MKKNSKLIPSIVFLALFSHPSAVTDAADRSISRIVYLGTYEQVESATGEHCSGYSIDLWKRNNVLFGLLHHHRGLCGDPPCGVLTDIRHNSETGVIRFKASTLEEDFHFSGSLQNNLLTGTLTKHFPGTDIDSNETVRLPKHRKRYLADELNSLEKWHNLYDPVARCQGVKEYMPNR